MIPELGIIEGFFGRPWSWAQRAEAVRSSAPTAIASISTRPRPIPICADAGRSPIRRPSWRSWPVSRALPRRGRAVRRRPQPVRAPPRSRARLAGPARRQARRAGAAEPDDLAILFDDMRGDVPDLAERQAAIVHFAAERANAGRILCCPSYYSDDPILDVAFGARPPFYLEQLGRLLDPAIGIFWTGRGGLRPRIHPRPPRPRRRAIAAQADALGQLSGQ